MGADVLDTAEAHTLVSAYPNHALPPVKGVPLETGREKCQLPVVETVHLTGLRAPRCAAKGPIRVMLVGLLVSLRRRAAVRSRARKVSRSILSCSWGARPKNDYATILQPVKHPI